jgi:SLT domain-containing protein
MVLERVPVTSFDDLLWIMAQESSGVVDARNPASSARGLYQLLRPQYSLNPTGEKSFGNPVEECQGGIRYIMGRYHTAALARAFWEKKPLVLKK